MYFIFIQHHKSEFNKIKIKESKKWKTLNAKKSFDKIPKKLGIRKNGFC